MELSSHNKGSGRALSGRIVAVCTGEVIHTAKREVSRAEVKEDFGLVGDAHAGPGHRQVSLIDAGRVAELREKIGHEVVPAGALGENFVVEGIDLSLLGIGTRLKLGENVLVEVTQIGKLCHDPCSIYMAVGVCPMSSEGLFGKVLRGGEVTKGDNVTVERLVERKVPQCVVVVISDRCFRGEAQETAGELLVRILSESGTNVFEKIVIPDEKEQIARELIRLSDERGADAVFTVGGTGMAPRDVTPEATRSVIEREVPGIPEAIRMTTLSKTPRSILSRGTSGIRGRTLIVNLPGSEKGVREAIEVILSVLGHAVETLRGSVEDCGR